MFMITRCMAPVKGICSKKQHSLKIDKIDLKTQEICRFILQEGCNLGQKKKAEKLVVIDSLAEQLQAYPHFYIADIESLNAEQTAALRRKCFESDVKLVVVKNTLLGKALEKVEKADADLVKVLEGPTSIMFTNVAKAPAVLIKEFRKKSEKPVLKAAFAEGCVYVGDDQLDALCNIKSKEELIADIVALLQSPAKNVISALQANAGQKIAGLVKTLESRNN